MRVLAGPAYRFHIDAHEAPEAARVQLCTLAGVVPGVQTRCMAPGWTHWYGIGKVEAQYYRFVTGFQLDIQYHGAQCLADVLQTMGAPWTLEVLHPPPAILNARAAAAELLQQGQERLVELTTQGEIRSWVQHFLLPHQLRAVAWNTTRPYWLDVVPCGGGKTLQAICSVLASPGPVLIMGPSHVRRAWRNQFPLYANVEPHMLLAASDRRASDETMQQYLARCHREQLRPVLVVGVEVLGDYLEELLELQPAHLLIDEVHLLGSTKRVVVQNLQDGGLAFHARETSKSGELRPDGRINPTRVTSANAAMQISRLRSLRSRGGLSATPLADGRPRRIYAPLDLLTGGGFGGYGSEYSRGFSDRYCGITKNKLGYRVDKGASNLEELKHRLDFFGYEVPYEESHAHVKKLQVEYVYLEPRDLSSTDRVAQAEVAQAERQWGKAPEGSERHSLLKEAKRNLACMRKRGFVIGECISALSSKLRTCVLVSRTAVADAWAKECRKETQGDVPVWALHSGVSDADRDTALDAYMGATTGACIFATGQSLGVSIDGLQSTHVGMIAMLPNGPDEFIQWRGRFERHGGIGGRLLVVIAAGTDDEIEAGRMVEKIGNVRKIQDARELDGADRGLLGMQDTAMLDRRILAKLGFTGTWAEEALHASEAGLSLDTAWDGEPSYD